MFGKKEEKQKETPKARKPWRERIIEFFTGLFGGKKKKRKNDVGKIYITRDGFFNDKPKQKKKRRVAVVEQRKDDGAVAVAKIMSKNGREEKIGKTFVPDLVLSPEQHISLTEDSVVERRVIFGTQAKKAIHTRELEGTEDRLTKEELKKIRKHAGGAEKKNHKTYKKMKKKWKRHFKQ